VPNSRIQAELGFILQAGICKILNFAQNPIQNQSVQGTELNWGGHRREKVYSGRGGHRTYFLNRGQYGGTPHIKTGSQYKLHIWLMARWVVGWVAGPVIIVPLRGSILRVETCQILSKFQLARWSPSVAIFVQLTYVWVIFFG